MTVRGTSTNQQDGSRHHSERDHDEQRPLDDTERLHRGGQFMGLSVTAPKDCTYSI